MKEKIAQWKITGQSHTYHHTLTATLQGGAQGQGKILGRFHYWAHSAHAKAAANLIAERIEDEAWDQGYTIQGHWDLATLKES